MRYNAPLLFVIPVIAGGLWAASHSEAIAGENGTNPLPGAHLDRSRCESAFVGRKPARVEMPVSR